MRGGTLSGARHPPLAPRLPQCVSLREAELAALDDADVPITPRTGKVRVLGKGDQPREVPPLPARTRPLSTAGECQSFRATPASDSTSFGRPKGLGSGRHRVTDTTPGSTSVRPWKKAAICSGLRRWYGTAPPSS